MSAGPHPGEALGAFVLGALDEAEAAQVRAHLAGCPGCRAEQERLADTSGLLAVVPAEAWTDTAQPSELGLRRLLGQVRAERGRRRNRLRTMSLAAAAVALTVAAGGVLWGLNASNPSGGPATAGPVVQTTATPWRLSASNRARGVSGQVDIVPVGWGSRLDVELKGVPQGSRCRLVVIDKSGTRWDAGSWKVSYGGVFHWSGGVAVGDRRIAAVEVRTTGGKRLLRLS